MTKADCVMYLTIGRAMIGSVRDELDDYDGGMCGKIIEAIDYASHQITLDLMADYAKGMTERDGDEDE